LKQPPTACKKIIKKKTTRTETIRKQPNKTPAKTKEKENNQKINK